MLVNIVKFGYTREWRYTKVIIIIVKHSLNVHVFKIQYNTLVSQGNGTEENVFEKRMVFKEDLKEMTGWMTDRNRELVQTSR